MLGLPIEPCRCPTFLSGGSQKPGLVHRYPSDSEAAGVLDADYLLMQVQGTAAEQICLATFSVRDVGRLCHR